MTDTLHVITNSLGSGDYIVVYETRCGDELYAGHSIGAFTLYVLLKEVSLGYDAVKYHELTDDQMENYHEHL